MLRSGTQTKWETLQNGATATGNGTVLDLTNAEDGGYHSLAVQISGTFVGTVSFEATVDGTNWGATGMVYDTDESSIATTATAGAIYHKEIHGLRQFRARISAYTSGTITVVASAVA